MKIAVMKLAAVAAGGARGASLRYMAAAVTHSFMGENFPLWNDDGQCCGLPDYRLFTGAIARF